MSRELDDFGIPLVTDENFGDFDEETSDVWGPVDALGIADKLSTSAPFQVNTFSSNSFADELFGFSGQAADRALASAQSTHSMITENSNSTVSTLPFPFYSRPTLPHVDDFIQKNELHYNNLRFQVKREKRSKIANSLDYKELYNSEASIGNDLLLKAKGLSRNSVIDDFEDFEYESDKLDENLNIYQIKKFVQYVMSFGEEIEFCPYSSSITVHNRKTGVSYQDVLNALRIHARTTNKFGKGVDYIQELLMASFDDLLFRSNYTHSEWFDASSQVAAGGEYVVTATMFNRSIRDMCEKHSVPVWSNSDLKVLRLHLSPEGETKPNLRRVLRAVRIFYSANDERERFEGALPIISKIKKLMKQRKHRVIDFFLLIERDPSEPVPPKRLVAAIRQLLVSEEAVLGPESSPYPESENTHSYPISERFFRRGRSNARPRVGPKKATSLEPLSEELTARIAAMHSAIQCRLSQAAGTTTAVGSGPGSGSGLVVGKGLSHNRTGPDSAREQPHTYAVTFAARTPMNRLAPLSPFFPLTSCKSTESALSSSISSPNTSYTSIASDSQRNVRTAVLSSDARPSKPSFNLSASFQSVVETRTQKLVSSLKQYDQKREHNLKRLAAFF